MKLYEIAEHYRAIMALVELRDGDLDGIEQELDAVGDAMADKVSAICSIIIEREAIAEARKNEAKRLFAAAKSDEATVERLKAYLAANVPPAGMQAGIFKVGFRKSEAIEIEAEYDSDLAKMALEYPDLVRIVTEYKPDKAAIKAAIKRGENINRARLVSRTSS